MRRAVERDLQIAVEALIDVCHRVLSLKGSPPAATSRAALADIVNHRVDVLVDFRDEVLLYVSS